MTGVTFSDLKGKTALITGANRGIGKGIADVFAQNGVNLALVGLEDSEGEKVAHSLRGHGVKVTWFAADLSEEKQVEAVFDAIVAESIQIDILVNNAACLESRDFLNLSLKDYETSFEKNVRIYYFISRLVAAHMVKRRSGVILNISSVGADRAHRGLAGYDAFKGAVNSLTRSMALDLAPCGIRVNALAPGAIGTLPEGQEDRREENFSIIPVGRPGTVSEIGAVAAFLASSAAAYIVGQVIVVDGGLSIQLTPPGVFV